MSFKFSRLILGALGLGVLSVEVVALALVQRNILLAYFRAAVTGAFFAVLVGYTWTRMLRSSRDRTEEGGLGALAWIVYWIIFIVVFFGLLPGIILPR